MDKPISVGDLVAVVRANECGCIDDLGHTFFVSQIRPTKPGLHSCTACKGRLSDTVVADQGAGRLYPLFTLKRIPPLDELESEKTKEELTA